MSKFRFLSFPVRYVNDVRACFRRHYRPMTAENLVQFYLPLDGVISYNVLALNTLNPEFVRNVMARYTYKDPLHIVSFLVE